MATIYEPFIEIPQSGQTLDMSQNQTIVVKVDGLQITAYQLFIYKKSDNSQVYDSTQITSFTTREVIEGHNVYLYIDHIINGNSLSDMDARELKCIIQIWNGAETVTSKPRGFYNYGTGTLTLNVPSTYNSQNLSVEGTFTHPQNILTESYYFGFYDNDDNLITHTERIYGSNIRSEFKNLVSGQTYKIKGFITDRNKINVESNVYSVVITYTKPSVNISPEVTMIESMGSPEIKWTNALQNTGINTGTPTYISDFMFGGNYGVQLDVGESFSYNIDIPIDFICTFIYRPLDTLDNNMVQFDDGNLIVGRYNANGYFYIKQGDTIHVFTNITLSTDKAYLIGISPAKLRIKEWYVFS